MLYRRAREKSAWLIAAIGFIAMGAIANAQSVQNVSAPSMVVELFTSQGCSSSPPADKVIGEFARQPNTVALTFPVDYWDYLGWKDTLARPAYSKRQKAYSHQRGDRQVYTPQAIVNGLYHVVGSKRAAIERVAATARHEGKTLTTSVRLSRSEKSWIVEVSAASTAVNAKVIALTFSKAKEVRIEGGENANRTVVYSNVVRTITFLGDWSGANQNYAVDPIILTADGVDGFAVLLQEMPNGKPGAILGAAISDK